MQQVDLRAAGLSPKELPVWQYLNDLYARHRPNQTGQLASYIPELSAVDPDKFSLAFATTDGFVYEVGDTGALFTIQSVSKAVIYALAWSFGLLSGCPHALQCTASGSCCCSPHRRQELASRGAEVNGAPW